MSCAEGSRRTRVTMWAPAESIMPSVAVDDRDNFTTAIAQMVSSAFLSLSFLSLTTGNWFCGLSQTACFG